MGKILKTCSEQPRLVSGCFIKVFHKMTTCPRQLLLSGPKSSCFIQVWMYLENVLCWILSFDANYICMLSFVQVCSGQKWLGITPGCPIEKGFCNEKNFKTNENVPSFYQRNYKEIYLENSARWPFFIKHISGCWLLTC